MLLHGVHYSKFDLRQEDTLEHPQHSSDMRFEAVVANPPFSANWSASDYLLSDDRFSQYGRLAPASKADFAFVQHMIHHLAENGIMAVILPHGVLFRGGSEAHIREYLIKDRNYLDAVIGLPPNIFSGMSGCGKSTLLKLLLGLYHPDAGEILLDGHVATPAIWRSWRSQIGVVAQDDRLLSGSIADNIAFFDPDLHMNRVYAAASAAKIHNDIMRMPMQYLSLIGDMGSALSGGQRQRVLLARALYRQPKVLILDEGTANIDEPTELEIAELISQLPITRIVVAHRPALVSRADTVYFLESGSLKNYPIG